MKRLVVSLFVLSVTLTGFSQNSQYQKIPLRVVKHLRNGFDLDTLPTVQISKPILEITNTKSSDSTEVCWLTLELPMLKESASFQVYPTMNTYADNLSYTSIGQLSFISRSQSRPIYNQTSDGSNTKFVWEEHYISVSTGNRIFLRYFAKTPTKGIWYISTSLPYEGNIISNSGGGSSSSN